MEKFTAREFVIREFFMLFREQLTYSFFSPFSRQPNIKELHMSRINNIEKRNWNLFQLCGICTVNFNTFSFLLFVSQEKTINKRKMSLYIVWTFMKKKEEEHTRGFVMVSFSLFFLR